jgi:molecular chaperone GrpE
VTNSLHEAGEEPVDSQPAMRIWHLAISCVRGLRGAFLKPSSEAMSETENTMPHADDPPFGQDDGHDAAPEPGSEGSVAERLAQLEAERDELRERWMRSEAEMANLRTRTKRDVEDARLYAVQKFARDVVEVAENLKRGLDSLPERHDGEAEIIGKLREGFEGIGRSFLATLERNGVSTEDPTGKLFDPNLHQAMAEQESTEHPPGTILQAWTNGWTLNGRLLRPAMVVVAKAPVEAFRQ